jgi:flagellar FliL protein
MSTATASASDEAPKKSKMPLIIAAAVLAVGGAGGGVWFYMKQQQQYAAEHVVEAPKKPPVFLPLDNFTVNLADRNHYLQAGLVFEVESTLIADSMKALMPVIRSRILMLLTAKTEEDLVAPGGKEKLAAEVIEAARESLPEKERKSVEKVHFSAFVIQ